jgi:hypothetical protein
MLSAIQASRFRVLLKIEPALARWASGCPTFAGESRRGVLSAKVKVSTLLMSQVIGDLALLEELVLGTAAGGRRKAAPLEVAKVRALGLDDLELLQNPPNAVLPVRPLQTIRHSHHQLARLIATGKADQEISLITGYSPSHISSLKGGQDFKDLIAYYSAQKELIFVETMERLKIVGLNTLDELQKRFDEAPEQFTNTQLMELIDLTLIKPTKTPQAVIGATSGGPVTVNVQFVSGAQSAPQVIEGSSREIVDDGY